MSNHSIQRTAEADGNVILQVLGHESQDWTFQFTLMGIVLTIHPTVDQLFHSKQKSEDHWSHSDTSFRDHECLCKIFWQPSTACWDNSEWTKVVHWTARNVLAGLFSQIWQSYPRVTEDIISVFSHTVLLIVDLLRDMKLVERPTKATAWLN